MKIATIVGARPQFIKAALISEELKKNKTLSEVIIHTGQHFDKDMSNIFFDEMQIPKPKYNLGINKLKYEELIDKMVKEIHSILTKENFDGVLVYGDTNSTLAGSISANESDLPIFHVESGLRNYNRNMPEEINRIITDHLSSLLFCPTKNSMENLAKENITNGVVFTGDVMYDSFLKFCKKTSTKNKNTKSEGYILSTIHRRENILSERKLREIFKNFNIINKRIRVLMPLHPHTKEKIIQFGIDSEILFLKPQSYLSMLGLLKNCEMVITDSGGLQKEAFFAKRKCLIIRNRSEWSELTKLNLDVLCKPEDIYENYLKISNQRFDFSSNFFGNGTASKTIVSSIENYFS